MADPLEITSAAVSVSKQVYNIIKSVKGASAELKSLEREIAKVHSILEQLIQTWANNKSYGSSLSRSVDIYDSYCEEARKLLEEAKNFIDRVAHKTQGGDYNVRKVQWVRHRSDAQSLTQQCQKFYTSLGTMQSITQMSILNKIGETVQSAEELKELRHQEQNKRQDLLLEFSHNIEDATRERHEESTNMLRMIISNQESMRDGLREDIREEMRQTVAAFLMAQGSIRSAAHNQQFDQVAVEKGGHHALAEGDSTLTSSRHEPSQQVSRTNGRHRDADADVIILPTP
ncbi:hypothetical protein EIP86_008448 [Pleurotus ostreatoroseus]|nr:hypothetical protein EIP86_008448 [Pleurotus ostreatoroseus]